MRPRASEQSRRVESSRGGRRLDVFLPRASPHLGNQGNGPRDLQASRRFRRIPAIATVTRSGAPSQQREVDRHIFSDTDQQPQASKRRDAKAGGEADGIPSRCLKWSSKDLKKSKAYIVSGNQLRRATISDWPAGVWLKTRFNRCPAWICWSDLAAKVFPSRTISTRTG